MNAHISRRGRLLLFITDRLVWAASTPSARAEARRLAAQYQMTEFHLHHPEPNGEQLLTLGTHYEDGTEHHAFWVTADGNSRPI